MTNPQDFFLPSDLIARALHSLMEQCHDQIDRLGRQGNQGDPTVKDETKFHLRQYRAFTKALYYWQQGVRPTPMPRGGWLIPSASRAGSVVHEVAQAGGVWVCGPTCPATEFHWHTALVLGLERAEELIEQEDDGDIEPYDAYEAQQPEEEIDDDPRLPDAAAVLGRRLAEARARLAA